jgi:hypothetical protein
LYGSRHTGIVLNETADATAKESMRKGEDAQYLIPGRDLKSHWKTKLRVATEEWYRESGKQKGRSTLSTTTKTMTNLGSTDSDFKESLSPP